MRFLVQVAYAIGVADPVGIYVNTFGTAKVNMSDSQIADKIKTIFDLRPYAIVKRFGLKNPVFLPTSTYGHFGRTPFTREVNVAYKDDQTVSRKVNGETKYFKNVEFFAWEKLDYVDIIKKEFGI
jgi:S-adenosylmethionine synthetase